VVLDDGEQWLVEVKNVEAASRSGSASRCRRLTSRSLQAYADMVATPLKLAIFWSLWNIWTIVSPERFRRPDGGLRVTMRDAVMASEEVRPSRRGDHHDAAAASSGARR
jgi:hypothetical protein